MTFSAEELGCPLPPADLAERRLATKTLDLEKIALWRIHRAHLHPIHYNRRAPGVTHYRFDAAGGEFGLCGSELYRVHGRSSHSGALPGTTSAVNAR
ncbi:hypothetical protein [Cupriavidus sp. L7L]|uniref:hypothetical protein n=1 Tax=Cupriavidus sp. L7L TaxID=2546443 RepID=UPI001FB7F348|nr:hypothetical protein [Cupriavidus sp. L7L]